MKNRPGYVKENVEKSFLVSLTKEGKKLVPEIKLDEDNEIGILTSEILNSGKWKNEKFTQIDVTSPVRTFLMGRTHPLTDIIAEIREIFVSMGFSEIEGSTIQSCFWNFDVTIYSPRSSGKRYARYVLYVKLN